MNKLLFYQPPQRRFQDFFDLNTFLFSIHYFLLCKYFSNVLKGLSLFSIQYFSGEKKNVRILLSVTLSFALIGETAIEFYENIYLICINIHCNLKEITTFRLMNNLISDFGLSSLFFF